MKLTTIEALSTGRFKLHFSDGTTTKVERSVVADCGLYSGMELSEDDMERLAQTQQAASAKARAVRIVSATAVSEKELRRRLRQKGEDAAQADAAVDWLKELGALDDGALAKRVAQQAYAKGYGPDRIRQALYQKNIPQEYWDEAMAGLEDNPDAIDRFLRQRLNGAAPDQKEKQKITDALRRRGFGWEAIRQGFRRYGAELEELE